MSIFGTLDAISKELSNRVTNATFLSSPEKPGDTPLQDMSSTTTGSSGEEEKPLVDNTTNDTADHSMHSDPSVNTTKLPEDHPIHLEDEARRFFRGRRPPFVIVKRRKDPKTVVLPTAAGPRAQKPKTAEIVIRSWDESTRFWTLDLNGIRYIVKPFRGAPLAGQKYLYWAGPTLGFDEKPLAFSVGNRRVVMSRYRAALKSQMAFETDTKLHPDRSQKHRRGTSTSSLSDSEDQAENESSATTGQHMDELDPQLQGQWQPVDINAESDHIAPQTKVKNALKKGKKPTRHSDLPQRVPFSAPDQSPDASRAAPAKRRKTHDSKQDISHLYSVSPPALQRSTIQRNGVGASSSQTERPATGAEQHRPARSKRLPTQQSPTEPITLSQQKQYRTTLLVRVASSMEYQPLKLTTCPNLATFFDQVLSVCDVKPKNVAKVTVTFLWLDLGRTMVMNPNREACWTHLLEQVDEAPCWEEEMGRCMLDVEIVGVE